MFRTVIDGKDGYIYGEWTTKTEAIANAEKLSLFHDLVWVEDEFHNRVIG